MKSLAELADWTLKLYLINGGLPEAARNGYPKNDWGIVLAHYDVEIESFRGARIETVEQSIRRWDVNKRYPERTSAKSWAEWQELNPELPMIPFNSATQEAAIEALEWLRNSPPPLRDALVILANGGRLIDDDWLVIMLMYGKFRACIEVLYSRDYYHDGVTRERGAWHKTNREKFKRYAATYIDREMQTYSTAIREARNVFLRHVLDVLEGKSEPIANLTRDGILNREEFVEFLGEPDELGKRLKKWYRETLTKNKLKNWVDHPIES